VFSHSFQAIPGVGKRQTPNAFNRLTIHYYLTAFSNVVQVDGENTLLDNLEGDNLSNTFKGGNAPIGVTGNVPSLINNQIYTAESYFTTWQSFIYSRHFAPVWNLRVHYTAALLCRHTNPGHIVTSCFL